MVWSLRLLYAVADPGEGPEGAATLFLDQTEAQKAGKNFFEAGLPLISGSGWGRGMGPGDGAGAPLIWSSVSPTGMYFSSNRMRCAFSGNMKLRIL